MTALPPGFVLDSAPKATAELPPGFVLDGQAPAMSAGEKATDAFKGLGTGVVKGSLSLGGAVGDLTDLGAKGIEALSNKASDALGIERYQRPETPSALNNIPTTESLTKRLKEALGHDLYQPKSDYGKAASAIGEFVPGAALATATGGGSLLGNAARYAVAPGAATFTADKVLPETDYKPYLVAGAGLGASLVNPARVVTPLPASAARQAAVDVLEREGVTSLTAGQRTGNQALRYLEDATSSAPGAGHGAVRMEHEGQRQFTEAALRRAGAEGAATPEILQATHERLSNTFRDLAARNNLVPDNRFINDIVDSVQRYRNVPQSFERAQVQAVIDDIIPHINAGQMPGQQYQAMRHYLTETANGTQDTYFANAMRGMRNALDNAMSRSISPEDAALWEQARAEWGAKKVLSKAASRAGEATAEGQITPANLRNTIAGENRDTYSRGFGPFNELARAGVQVMTPLPNSGTAQRLNALHLLNAGLGGIPQALAGRVVMSEPVQRIIANQLMTGQLPVSAVGQNLALIEALQRSQPAIEAK